MWLIDGSFLEERCKRQISAEWNKKAAPSSWADAYEQFLTDIENCPTVDAVPVVRCKDCKHCFVDGDNVRFNVCELNHNRVQADDWFCADGERKGGDE